MIVSSATHLDYNYRSKIIFISWVPSDTPTLVSDHPVNVLGQELPLGQDSSTDLYTQWSMIYASTREVLKNALNLSASIHADDKSDIEWKTVLSEASGGKAGK